MIAVEGRPRSLLADSRFEPACRPPLRHFGPRFAAGAGHGPDPGRYFVLGLLELARLDATLDGVRRFMPRQGDDPATIKGKGELVLNAVTALRGSLKEKLAEAAWRPLRELAALQAAGRVAEGTEGKALEQAFLERIRRGPLRGEIAPYRGITLSLEPGGSLRAVVALPEHFAETAVEPDDQGRRYVRWPASTAGFELPLHGRTSLRPTLLTWDPAYQRHPTVRWEATSGRVCIATSAQVVADELDSRGMGDAGLLLAETLLTLRNGVLYGVLPGERCYHPYGESIPRGQVGSCSAADARRLAQERGIEIVRWPA